MAQSVIMSLGKILMNALCVALSLFLKYTFSIHSGIVDNTCVFYVY